jgi:hypothetical protein
MNQSTCSCNCNYLVVQLRAAPVAALLVPLDAVTSAQTDPVRNRLVLVHLLRVLLLHRERLEATHFERLLGTEGVENSEMCHKNRRVIYEHVVFHNRRYMPRASAKKKVNEFDIKHQEKEEEG